MDVYVGSVETTVRAVDDRPELSPAQIDAIAAQVIARLDARRSSQEARTDEAAMWTSVRDGRSR